MGPLTIQASFLLSGMLGLQLEGISDGNGTVQVIQTSVPFSISSNGGTVDQNRNVIPKISIRTDTSGFSNPTPTSEESCGCLNSTKPSTEQIFNNPSKFMKLDETSSERGKCGSKTCLGNDLCVTWNKIGWNLSRNTHYECRPDDGLHYTKVDPLTQGSLCPLGQSHKILYKPMPCLRDEPPCDLVWKYDCVPESASPHSCQLKRCPSGTVCIENLHCGLLPPCYTTVQCREELGIHHQTFRN